MKTEELRKSILQLAIQGKLVEQNPADEPASVLLERIRAEKQQFIKEGKIKRDKNESVIYRGDNGSFFERIGKEVRCIDDEIPFEIPDSWEWCRLKDVCQNIHYGYTASASYKGNARLLRITDIQNNSVIWDNVPFCNVTDKELLVYKLSPNDILIARTGGTIGKTYIVKNVVVDSVFASYLIRAIPQKTGDADYVKLFLETPFYWSQLISQSMGTGQPNVNGEALKSLLMPIPPLAEQQRVVERLNDLEPLFAEYERLELQESKLEKNFSGDLNKSILQHAIQGKLVAQNPADEPASVLLEHIRAEKEQLIKEKKIKRDKNESVIYRGNNGSFFERIGKEVRCIDDEIPFEIPDSWEWVRLKTILNQLTDGTHSTPKYTLSGVPFLSVKDVSNGVMNFDNTRFISMEEHSALSKRCNPQFGDILLTKVGTTGVPVLINTDKEFSIFVSIALLKYSKMCLNPDYLIFMLKSPLVQLQAKQNTRGVGNKNWVLNDIGRTLIPIPPLAEQQRIVEKLEQIKQIIKQ